MSINALTTDGRFPVRRKRPNRPSVDNAFRSSWCPHFGVRFKVLENVPQKRLVLSWIEPAQSADKAEHTRVAMDIETVGEMVRLTVTHDELNPDMARKIANGWPRVLSSLKSFLETGRPPNTWA